MNRSTVRTVSSVLASLAVVATTLVSAPFSAQAQSLVLTPEQVRGQFAQQGYNVGAPNTWNIDNVTTFAVADPREPSRSARVLMVLVYGDDATASSARDRSRSSGQPLVQGYGDAAWQGNVALVQSSVDQLHRFYQAQEDRSNGILVETANSADIAAPGQVDTDFLMALAPMSML